LLTAQLTFCVPTHNKIQTVVNKIQTFKPSSPITIYTLGLQKFWGKRPHPLLWAGSRAARGKITINGVPV